MRMAIVVSIPILLLSLFLSIPFFYSYFYHFAQQRAVSASAQRQQRVASAIDDRYGPLSPAHVQYSTVQYDTSQHGTAQCSSVVAVDVYLTFCTSQRHALSSWFASAAHSTESETTPKKWALRYQSQVQHASNHA